METETDPQHSDPHFNRAGFCVCPCDECGRWAEFCRCEDCPCWTGDPELHRVD